MRRDVPHGLFSKRDSASPHAMGFLAARTWSSFGMTNVALAQGSRDRIPLPPNSPRPFVANPQPTWRYRGRLWGRNSGWGEDGQEEHKSTPTHGVTPAQAGAHPEIVQRAAGRALSHPPCWGATSGWAPACAGVTPSVGWRWCQGGAVESRWIGANRHPLPTSPIKGEVSAGGWDGIEFQQRRVEMDHAPGVERNLPLDGGGRRG